MSPTTPKQLSRFVHYIIGRHPEQFAVVPDFNGYVPVKTLLKVFHEEDGWRHIRVGHLKEALLTLPDVDFEMSNNRIRALNRDHLPEPEPAIALPALLHTAVRRRAHQRVMDRGVGGSTEAPILLCREKALAERLGHRQDPSPVLLAVNTDQAQLMGVTFWTAGDGLYTATDIPVGCFTAPPLPKAAQPVSKPQSFPPPQSPPTPGSFVIDASVLDFSSDGVRKRKKDQKRKRRRQAPPWRN